MFKVLKNHPTMGSTEAAGNNGVFIFKHGGFEITCIASDGMGWEHVSVSLNKKKNPSWEIMTYVKSLFWDEEDAVIQFHPPRSEYVNNHPYCLHLWRPIDQEFPLPQTVMV